MVKKLVGSAAIAVAMAVGAMQVTALAQGQRQSDNGTQSTDCSNGTFASGSGSTQFSVCVSSHGNIPSFRFNNSEVIANGTVAEGYVVCATVGSAASTYYDIGYIESGWGAATASTPGHLPITITRSTTDGAFTLTQKYAVNKNERSATITMTLKANVPAVNVRLARQVDIDVDENLSGSFQDVFDRSLESVWGRQTRAFTAQAATFNIAHTAAIAFPSGTCDVASATGPITTDSGASIQYNLGSLSAGHAKTFKTEYRGM